MCGICGEMTFGGPCHPAATVRMTNALHARGPDAGGIFSRRGYALGHRRLSILDLSTRSDQPMVDTEMRVAVVFNGCLYNFNELRAELISLGYRFFSSGDTEVICKAYRAWGPACVHKFIGMFAFGLVELDTGKLVLVRDRLGIKPLYYSITTGGVRFASTLPALLAGGGIDTSLSKEALHHYFSFHAVIPPPLTILAGVRKLPPATILTIAEDGTRSEHRYWDFTVGAKSAAMSEDECRSQVDILLRQAVRRRTVSDVPMGVLLSGGLDSSLLVGLLAYQGAGEINTFSIGFDAVGDTSGDEFAYSDVIAAHFGTRHHRIRIANDKMIDALPAAIQAMSEPMVSHDNVAFYLLSQEVSRHVKVVQCGQGADEVFGGYHWHQKMRNATDGGRYYASHYFEHTHGEIADALATEFQTDDVSTAYVQRFFADHPGTALDGTLQIDTEVMLADDPVKRLDNMTMAFGLEARVPFLDHELVEFAARIPADVKMGKEGKRILKEIARNYLPHRVIDRPKGYFPVPGLKLLRGAIVDYLRLVLTSERARSRGLFNRDYIDKLLREPDLHMTGKGNSKLWQAGLLEGWLQTHGV